MYALFTLLGVDPTKPAELCHWGREPSGLYLTGGWFHFVGRILEGEDAVQGSDGTGMIKFQALPGGAELALTMHISLLPAAFRDVSVCQLEFHTRIPWVLPGVEPAL
jgi:hypothetical protein